MPDKPAPAEERTLRDRVTEAASIRPQDVPSDLVEALLDAAEAADLVMPRIIARQLLADLLPKMYRYWFEAAFGTPEEIAAREAEAASRKPDDTVRLCEMARPGEHSRRVREQVAADLKRAAAGRRDYATRAPDHIAAELEGEARVFDTASRVAAAPREVMWGLLPASMWTDADLPANREEAR